MIIRETVDVWNRMASCGKPIVLYGMGNGADKILAVMDRYGITCADFFASDGFVRGHSFHGKRVLSYSEVCEKYEDMLIVISFASSLPDVLSRFYDMAERYETVAPDVPVAGDTLFTAQYFTEHRAQFEAVYDLLADEESRTVYQNIIEYKISGKLSYLQNAVSDKNSVMQNIVHPENMTSYLDLGAYNGDTVRELLAVAPALRDVYAMEPDPRNFRKLSAYAEEETRARVQVYPYAAWDKYETLAFSIQGSRNSTVAQNITSGIQISQAKERTAEAASPDTILGDRTIDYIKYDVEGAEARALRGSASLIRRCHPKLLLSLYHRTEDLFALPLLLHEIEPAYRLYLRRFAYVPAWDINLYCVI